MRTGSPRTTGGRSSAMFRHSLMSFAAAIGANNARVRISVSIRPNGMHSMESLPASIFDKSYRMADWVDGLAEIIQLKNSTPPPSLRGIGHMVARGRATPQDIALTHPDSSTFTPPSLFPAPTFIHHLQNNTHTHAYPATHTHQQIVQYRHERVSASKNHGCIFSLRLVQRRLEQALAKAQNAIHRRAYLKATKYRYNVAS